MASTTKIATAITAIEHGNLSDMVVTSKKAADVEGSSIWLEEGEKMSLENLLYGLMLSSGNDAAIAIAEHISGSDGEFAKLMTQTARTAGANNTSFKNPNGLDEEGHYTTAGDLAKIAAYGLKNEFFAELVKTKSKVIPWEGHEWGRSLKNHNKMLFMYEGANGVKTGFTKKSGRCLVSGAQRDGIQLIAVTLNAPSDWDDHRKMLDYGFSELKSENIVCKNSIAVSIGVSDGVCDIVNGVYESDFILPVMEKDVYEIKNKVTETLEAPVKKGDCLGYAEVFLNNKKVGEVRIISDGDCEKKYIPTLWDNLRDLIKIILL
jgi:D-alanyl-D-alanine carboxypeptidase (penicillin-binding protein 5/6)